MYLVLKKETEFLRHEGEEYGYVANAYFSVFAVTFTKASADRIIHVNTDRSNPYCQFVTVETSAIPVTDGIKERIVKHMHTVGTGMTSVIDGFKEHLKELHEIESEDVKEI